MVFFLAFREVLHSKWRFLLISLIVALITTLVLFIAALTEGLGAGNRDYLEKLNGQLVAFQANVDLSSAASRIGRSRLNEMRRVAGVEDVGQVATATSTRGWNARRYFSCQIGSGRATRSPACSLTWGR